MFGKYVLCYDVRLPFGYTFFLGGFRFNSASRTARMGLAGFGYRSARFHLPTVSGVTPIALAIAARVQPSFSRLSILVWMSFISRMVAYAVCHCQSYVAKNISSQPIDNHIQCLLL
jgi:hypothetical protein